MGCADYAFTLWSEFLRFNPDDPQWVGRDRFVLSAGHGSMLIYSLLHLFDFGLTIDDLKTFRQWGSKCPGHPEYGHTKGVEVTTGPLASGLASAVGMAIGMKQFKAAIGGCDCLFDQKVYVISGDGCIMEGTSHEACALAGHLKLDNLILFYDDNGISIEGSTKIALTEDVGARFAAYGWNVIKIDGQCVKQIRAAIEMARVTKGKPTVIIGKTKIGKGAPNMEGSEATHGAPLPKEELAAAKVNLGFNPEESFVVPAEVRALCEEKVAAKKACAAAWNEKFEGFKAKMDADKKALMNALMTKAVPANILEELLKRRIHPVGSSATLCTSCMRCISTVWLTQMTCETNFETSERLWETSRMVTWRLRSPSSSNNCVAFSWSRLAAGSSKRRSCGSETRACAMRTRCR